jgi:hypothetical protein
MPGMHGLPYEHDAPLSGWEEAIGHLQAIAGSKMAVTVSVKPPGKGWACFQARGKLVERAGAHEDGALFAINTNTSREEGGYVWIEHQLFRDGSLTTYDGDDYFHLRIGLEGATLLIEDTNQL